MTRKGRASDSMGEDALASWDVFHGDRLALERGLDSAALRGALARGELREYDLVRPSESTVSWVRLAELPELMESTAPPVDPAPPVPPAEQWSARESIPYAVVTNDFEVQTVDPVFNFPHSNADTLRDLNWSELRSDPDDVAFPVIKDLLAESTRLAVVPQRFKAPPPSGWLWAADVDHEADNDDIDQGMEGTGDSAPNDPEILDDKRAKDLEIRRPSFDEPDDVNRMALPVVDSRGWDDMPGSAEADADDVVSLSRSGPATVEELDLAPMVDVAFQLVLFFMVTATTVLYKTLEIPKPAAEQAPTAALRAVRSLIFKKTTYSLRSTPQVS